MKKQSSWKFLLAKYQHVLRQNPHRKKRNFFFQNNQALTSLLLNFLTIILRAGAPSDGNILFSARPCGAVATLATTLSLCQPVSWFVDGHDHLQAVVDFVCQSRSS